LSRINPVEHAVLERLARDPAVAIDPQSSRRPHLRSRGRTLRTEIHGGYPRSAREAGLPILLFTDTWRCSRSRMAGSRFRGRPVNEDNARFLQQLR
jgi:homocysteine S-methyltransferase